MNDEFSFVIPALNEQALIGKCIRSIQNEALGCEIIVVDNGSTDNTIEIARRYGGVTIIKEPKKGVTRARQAGLMAASTKYVAFIDADNRLPKGWLKEAKKAMQNAVAASGPPVFLDQLILARSFVFAFYCAGRALHTIMPMLQGGNFIVDRKALIKAGGFDTSIDFYGEDTATAKRLSKVGKVRFSLGLYCFSSGRRLRAEGLFKSGARYAANYAWIYLAGKPLTKTHHDHRDAA